MLGTRYEEYTVFDNNLPYIFTRGINVTSAIYSQEANWHENLELQLCTEGRGYVSMDEKKYEFPENCIAVINSNVLHHTSALDSLKYDCLIIDTAFCKQAGIDPALLEFAPCFESSNISALFSRLYETQENTRDVCRRARLNEIILKILIELRENHTVGENTGKIKKRSFDTVKAAIKYIRKNYGKKLSLDEISQNVYMDKFTLSKEFKKLTGRTVVQYLNSYRCKKAADYISDGASVADAARMCGFTNMSFFTKTFKSYMGCLPSQYK